MLSLNRLVIATAAILPLAACGGGSPATVSPTAPTPPVASAPPAPQIIMTVQPFRPAATAAARSVDAMVISGPIPFFEKRTVGVRVTLNATAGTLLGRLRCGVREDAETVWSQEVRLTDFSIGVQPTTTERQIQFSSVPAKTGGFLTCRIEAEGSVGPVEREMPFTFVEHTRLAIDACTINERTMCMLNERFQAMVEMTDEQRTQAAWARVVERFFDGGRFKLYDRDGNPVTTSEYDLFVRMMDRCTMASPRYEMLVSGPRTLSLLFTLRLRDMRTGRVQEFRSDPTALSRQIPLDGFPCQQDLE